MIRAIATLVTAFTIATAAFGAAPMGELGPGVPAFTVRRVIALRWLPTSWPRRGFFASMTRERFMSASPIKGSIVALREPDANGVYRKVTTTSKTSPRCRHVFHDGWLWFSQSTSIGKARGMNDDGSAEEVVTVIAAGKLPGLGGHWWRSILVDDDGFYTSIGDSSNLSDQTSTDRQKIWHFDLEGDNKKLFCTGIRNTEKLLYRPGTKELWGCDHGSDNFGRKVRRTHGADAAHHQSQSGRRVQSLRRGRVLWPSIHRRQ